MVILEISFIRLPVSTATLFVQNVTTMITKETLELMDHRYVILSHAKQIIILDILCFDNYLLSTSTLLIIKPLHRVNKDRKGHTVLRAHQGKKVTQVPMESLEMMVILVNLDQMEYPESATIDWENL